VRHILKELVRDIDTVTKEGLPLLKPLPTDPAPATSGAASTNMWYSIAAPQPSNDWLARNSKVP
jgi:hypothetical protein